MKKAENIAKIIKELFKQEDLNMITKVLETIANEYIDLDANKSIGIRDVASENEKYLREQLTMIKDELKKQG